MKKLSGSEENRILGLAAELEKIGECWVDEFRSDNEYIKNSRPILEISSDERCSVHYSRNFEWTRMKVPFWWKGKDNVSMINIPINYCKFCKKLFLPLRYYDKFKNKGEFLCRLSINNILVNDLTEDDVKRWEKEENEKTISGLCSIDKDKVSNLLNIEKKRAQIPIVNESGKTEYENVPVYYSKNTNCCYIYNETVCWLKTKGIILCRLFKATKTTEAINDFHSLNTESLIHQYGYNVSATDDLSVYQRRKILLNLIEQRILSIEEIKNHLAFLININKNVWKMSSACSKWREDFNYLDNIEKNMFEVISPEELVIKNIIISN